MAANSFSLTFSPDFVDHVQSWPLIPSQVPTRPLNPEEHDELQRLIEGTQAVLLAYLGNIDSTGITFSNSEPDFYASDKYYLYEHLQTLLQGARTPEQIRNLIAGFIIKTIDSTHDSKWVDGKKVEGRARQELVARLPGEVQPQIKPYARFDKRQEGYAAEHRLRHRNTHIWASDFFSRRFRGMEHVLTDALNPSQQKRYAYEPNHDSVSTFLMDPDFVFPKHLPIGEKFTKRNVPDNKRMTSEKISRFFQLPGLAEYIADDEKMADEAISSNLTIIAEYFCENDDVLYRNEIKPEDIDVWMKQKFATHPPSQRVATYMWARLLGTNFEGTALWIEQYILDLLQQENSWVFQSAAMSRDECHQAGSLFDLYQKAMESREASSQLDRCHDLYYLIPAKELLEAAMGSKNYKERPAIKSLHARVGDVYQYLPDKYTAERFENDFDGFCLDLFQESIAPSSMWGKIEGFELLDPMAIDGYSHARGWVGFKEIYEKTLARIRAMEVPALLNFKYNVVNQLPEPYREKAERMISEIVEKMVAKASFADISSQCVADMAMGIGDETAQPQLILPGGIPFASLVGKEGVAVRLARLAELAVLERHLGGTEIRGGRQIIDYLLDHRTTMVPVDLVTPSRDAPNIDIINQYAESPDLLSYLTIATLLVYLGFDYDQIMAEVDLLSRSASNETRSELSSVGVEFEQVSATPEGQIVNPRKYPWLFNVLGMGGDKNANEVKTPPTMSPLVQRYIFALITEPRFQFIFTDMLWQASERADRNPNSLHVNVAISKEIPFSRELVEKYMAPVQEMQWLANGGRVGESSGGRGRISGWRSGALLDVMADKHDRLKVEMRNLSLDKEGDYGRQIEILQLLTSAGVQFMREKAGLALSSSGKVMAQIYESYSREAKIVLQAPKDTNVQIAARALMEKYADLIDAELSRSRSSKSAGIVRVIA